MKYLALLLCYVFLFRNTVNSQNLLNNGGFEERNDDSNNPHPDDKAQVEYLRSWEDCMSTKDCDFDGDSYIHSPDYYRNDDYIENQFYYSLKETYYDVWPIPTNWDINQIFDNSHDRRVEAHTGNGFTGMAAGELIEQELSTLPMNNNSEYTIRFYVRTFYSANQVTKFGNQESGFNYSYDNAYGGSQMHILIGKKKIKYANKPCNCSGDDQFTKEDGLSQEINLVKSIPINTSLYPPGKWHLVEETFTSPNNNANWFAMEYVNANNCNVYIGLDDISLFNCPLNCSRTQGEMWPCYTNETNINSQNPFKMECLGNVKAASISAYDLQENIVYNEHTYVSEDGFNWPLYWAGVDGGGANLLPGQYKLNIVLINDCGPKLIRKDVSVYHFEGERNNVPSSYPTIQANNLPAPSNLLLTIPSSCCLAEPDIYLDDVTLDRNYPMEFWATENIFAATQSQSGVKIKSPTEVTFKAGSSIELGDGFETETGAEFLAEIVPCPELRKEEPVFTFTNPANPHLNHNSSDNSTSPPAYSLHPNPNTGRFTLTQTTEGYIKKYSILNMMGQVLLSSPFGAGREGSVDISSLPKGIYILQLETTEGLKAERVVYQ